MFSPAPHPHAIRPRATLAGLLALVLAVTLLSVSPPRAAAADGELLPNFDFAQGSSGWRTNNSSQNLRILSGGIAQLTTTSTGHAVLNDSDNSIKVVSAGSKYAVSARVRTTTPNVGGALRVREVGTRGVNTSQTSFTLRDTSWRTVTLDVTTVDGGSHLDINVVGYRLPTDKNLQIDFVSVRKVASSGSVTPPPAPSGSCQSRPPSGTIFGSSMSTSNQTFPVALQGIDAKFGRVGVIRHFSPGLPLDWGSRNAQLLKDRTLVMSFKAPPKEITSGKHDTYLRKWFADAPSNQTIYWSYYHEPENNINAGEFTSAQYRSAWAHIATLEQKACKPNMHATLILTEWTMQPRSKRDYRTYDAGPEYVKVLAFDPYNGATDPNRSYYEAPQDLLGPIVSKMKADGRPWGIAELGSRRIPGDSSGKGRAAWLTSVADYSSRNAALFVTYFNSRDFVLTDQDSIRVWSDLVKR